MNRASSVIWIFLAITLSGSSVAATIYVDADATGANDGSSWADAYNYLQDALADANSSAKPVEIRVAHGIYTPDSNSNQPNGSGDREATFQLISGVTLKGGYAGFGQPDPNAQDIELYETILSGDLEGNDQNVKEPSELYNNPSRAENSYHVTTNRGLNTNAVIDGFTITSGNADGSWVNDENRGGGMYNQDGSLTVANCFFIENSAIFCGGGMYNNQSNPTLINCTFTVNSADGIGSYGGGGMYNKESDPMIINCIFSENLGSEKGGGMYNWTSSPSLTNCIFSNNTATVAGGAINDYQYSGTTLINCTFSRNSAYHGGGMYVYYSSTTLMNCFFVGNHAQSQGGAMVILGSIPTLTNCTFASNIAGDFGGGLSCRFIFYNSPKLDNCILWENSDTSGTGQSAQIYLYKSSIPTVSYSCIQDADPHDAIVYPGIGNIDDDPLFVTPGYWDTNGTESDPSDDFWVDGDYHLSPDSPCLDVGDNTALPPDIFDIDGDGDIDEPIPLDLDGNPRIVNGIVDMGVYEGFIIHVAIDIKPGSYPNAINLGSHGLIPVAILSSDEFDATSVDADTVELAGAGVSVRGKSNKFMAHEEDVNGDGLLDLVVQVTTANLDPNSFQDGYAILTGDTSDGQAIEGQDEITIVPPEK